MARWLRLEIGAPSRRHPCPKYPPSRLSGEAMLKAGIDRPESVGVRLPLMDARHQCRPPPMDPGATDHSDEEGRVWTCPECEGVWALETIGEGQRLGGGGDRTRFIVREWIRRPPVHGDFS
jgi:hypothetical protein